MEPLRKAERIAALLDGRLDERERAALLAELGASDDDLELLLDSAAITRELEEEDAAGGAPATGQAPAVVTADPRPAEVIPITDAPSRRRRPRWWADPRSLAAAAVLVLAVGSAFWLARPRAPGSPVDALAIRSLPANWSHPWGQTRGDDDEVAPAAIAFRFGLLVTDLEVAARAHDHAAANSVVDSVAVLLSGSGSTALLAGDYREMRTSRVPPTLTQVRRQTAKTESGLADRPMVEFGRWTEAARLAAAEQQTAFFRSPESRPYVAGPAPRGLNGTMAAALKRVQDALGKGGVPDWPGLQNALNDLVEEAG